MKLVSESSTSDGVVVPRDVCVLRYALERHARESGGATYAVFEDGESWTYSQTLSLVRDMASGLYKAGVRQGDRVVIMLPNGALALKALFGVNYLGAIFVPINPASKGSLLAHVINDSGAKLAIVHEKLIDRVVEAGSENLKTIISSGAVPRAEADNCQLLPADCLSSFDAVPEPPSAIEPWHTQSIIYTSGTTGRSKGVLSSYMHSYSAMSPETWNCTRAGDRHLLHMPVFHIGGAFIASVCLCVGSSVAVVSGFKTDTFWKSVREMRVTVAFLLGAMATFLLKAPEKSDDRDHGMRMVFIVPLGQSGPTFRERFGVEVYTLFNMTEISTPLISDENPTKANSCGRPRMGVDVRLVDDNDVEVPTGAVGQLVVRTARPWAMNHGYNNNLQATVDAWRNGWFHTGDAFIRDADGDFFFVDRMKDTIRRRGENISSYEIEVELLTHPSVREAAAVPVPSELSEDDVLAVVSATEGQAIDPLGLVSYLRSRVAYHMIPRYIRVVSDLPKTPTEKVQKHVLREQGVTADTWDRERAGVVVRREIL